MSAEQTVRIDSTTPLTINGTVTTTPSGTQTVSGFITASLVKDPSVTGVYVFSLAEIPGVVAATNHLALFNPIGSGKNVIFGGAFISSTSASGSTITDPMRGFRATLISGGVLQADSASAKFVTANPDPVAEIRTGNPAATLDGAMFNSPPAISATTGVTPVHAVPVPGGTGPFLLVPGEGMVMRTAVGDVDQRWNLSVVWAEA